MQTNELVACHECDLLHERIALEASSRAQCSRCGAALYRAVGHGVERPLALALAALGLFLLAHAFPFVSLNIEGRTEQNLVISGIITLWNEGLIDLAILVSLTSVVFPLLIILGMLWLTIPLKLGVRSVPGAGHVYRYMHVLGPWSLLAVFMLGALVAFVKLLDLASVIPGASMFAFAALMLVATAANSTFVPQFLWPPEDDAHAWFVPGVALGHTAKDLGLLGCHVCTALTPLDAAAHGAPCHRCGVGLHEHRKADSLKRTWALVIAAGLMVVPANVYPVMTVVQLGRGEPSTIMSGVVALIDGGMWGLAMIVFFASIVVPLAKLTMLVYLLISVQRRSAWRPVDRTRLYRVTEVVGAWSMVDIFLVGILSALVNLDALATIEPGIGASYFGAVVVLTMFAAQSFDPRLIWDHAVSDKR